ncbi:MAG: hypothetical protein J6J27_01110 [Alphaproteobacteria bacterium]|nr:hypothetical protein [Alphaproteobacteria bacterium]
MIYEKYLEDIEFKKIYVPFDKIDETIKIYQTLYFLIGMEFLAETSQNDKLHYNYLLGNIERRIKELEQSKQQYLANNQNLKISKDLSAKSK